MGLWEIDTLLTSSVELIKDSKLAIDSKKQIIWNLENIPAEYEFDAGGFEMSETDSSFDYKTMNAYELGMIITAEAKSQNKHNLIYDWSAFLMNFWSEYFAAKHELESVMSNYLVHIRAIYKQLDFTAYEPIHATLTIYKEGNKWFSEEQNDSIKWFCS